MDNATKKKKLLELRDMSGKDYEYEYSENSGNIFVKGNVKPYFNIANGLEELNLLDFDYLKNHNKIKSDKISDYTFDECLTELTFLLRAERFAPGAFYEALEDKTVYKLLDRAIKTIDKE